MHRRYLSSNGLFTGPLVRFEASTIVLNGARSSAGDLLGWAQKKYERSAEPTLWVQYSPDKMPLAESTLLRRVQSLPHLKLRRSTPTLIAATDS